MIRIVACDYETVELTDAGPQASTEAYRPNFRVASCAFTERVDGALKSWFVEGEDAVRAELVKLAGARIVVHNAAFETLVTRCRFPDLTVNWYADTMRLAQVYDNGGKDSDFDFVLLPENNLVPDDKPKLKRIPTQGFGLVKCAHRILGEMLNHKAEAYDWLRANVPKAKGHEGSLLHLLPKDILERYNIADTEITLRLYEYCTTYFRDIGFDWTLDHGLYFSSVHHVVGAQIRGVAVDRDALRVFEGQLIKEIDDIGAAFRVRFIAEIAAVEYERLQAWAHDVKTAAGASKRFAKWDERHPTAVKAVAFNVGSNKQLERLFVSKLGIEPKFFTEKGSPSFKSSHLGVWGEGGEMLKTRRKRMIVLKQTQALLALSEFDGRWHPSLKVSGTSSGRMAGGSSG